MTIASVLTQTGDIRLVAPLAPSGRGLLVDLTRAYADLIGDREERDAAMRLAAARVPSDMIRFLRGGRATPAAAREAVAHATRAASADHPIVAWLARGAAYEEAAVTFRAPVPVGPFLVTADEIQDLRNLRIRCWVNDERRQDASTSEMIHSVAEIVSYYSKMTIEPGDRFTTGSPAGVGVSADPPERHPLKPGDVVEIEIAPIGKLRDTIVEDH